jgi:hypothetical protein
MREREPVKVPVERSPLPEKLSAPSENRTGGVLSTCGPLAQVHIHPALRPIQRILPVPSSRNSAPVPIAPFRRPPILEPMFTLVLIGSGPKLKVPWRNRIFRPAFCCGVRILSQEHFHARQAAAALLKMAKTTSDPNVVAGLVDAAAVLKDQAGELPPEITSETPEET